MESGGKVLAQLMQTYSIILARNSKKYSVGGGMTISCHHAHIFYDFTRRRFALKVLCKNDCLVEGVLHILGNPPMKLDSQHLLQIGDKEFYFLLLMRSILGGLLGPRHYVNHSSAAAGGAVSPHYNYHMANAAPGAEALVKKGRRDYYNDDDEDDDDIGGTGSSGKKIRRDKYEGYGYGDSGSKAPLLGFSPKKEIRDMIRDQLIRDM